MDAKQMSLYAKGYWFLARNILAGKFINKTLDLLAFLDYRMLIYLSSWHPDMDTRIRYLRRRGLQVGENVHLDLGVYIEVTTPQAIVLEDYAGLAYCCNILGHDAGANALVDIPMRVRQTRIGYNSLVGSYATIMPGVQVGAHCGIVAGSVVTKNVPDGEVWGGNPAGKLTTVGDVALAWQELMKRHPEYYYDHDNPNRAPDSPFAHLLTWRQDGPEIQPDSVLRTGTPFDYILDAKAMKKK